MIKQFISYFYGLPSRASCAECGAFVESYSVRKLKRFLDTHWVECQVEFVYEFWPW